MNQVRKDSLALRTTVLGILAHYVYSILLFLHSQLTDSMTLLPIALYLAAAGVPTILLCTLTLKKDKKGSRGGA